MIPGENSEEPINDGNDLFSVEAFEDTLDLGSDTDISELPL